MTMGTTHCWRSLVSFTCNKNFKVSGKVKKNIMNHLCLLKNKVSISLTQEETASNQTLSPRHVKTDHAKKIINAGRVAQMIRAPA
jgi:hypothetical protein